MDRRESAVLEQILRGCPSTAMESMVCRSRPASVDEETRRRLFSLLEEHILPGTNRNVGRPGMELWRILVMGVLKQGLVVTLTVSMSLFLRHLDTSSAQCSGVHQSGATPRKHKIGGWRQWRHLTQEVKKCFNKVRSTRRAKSQPDRVEAYIERCCRLVDRAEESCKELEQAGVAQSGMIQSLIAHARRQIDQVERRLLKGETIAHDEKVFSIFEEHTRWVSKGKAGCAVELRVPVCVVEDQFQFILHHKILWEWSYPDSVDRLWLSPPALG